MANSFKAGDIVQLKSGGPAMTVTDPDAYGGNIATTWFAGANKKNGTFPAQALEAVNAVKTK
jgi:uncharacterized protein YodC (DUF2158 family)